MRVELDNGRTTVQIDTISPHEEKFLHLVAKALRALNYSLDDLEREFALLKIINETEEK